MDLERQKAEAVERARSWITLEALILDTETTGLDGKAEACQISVLDLQGVVRLDQLVRTTHPIPVEATRIHHIAEADVEDAPRMREILPRLEALTAGRQMICYNLAFDARILKQTVAADLPGQSFAMNGDCAMRLYSLYRGEWNAYHGDWRWFSLSAACALEGIPTADVALHSAVGDCELTRRLIYKLAGKEC